VPATSSAPNARRRTPLSRLPIRLRLAVSVGAVTFGLLTVFGVAVRELTAHRLRSNLDSQLVAQGGNLADAFQPIFGTNGITVSPQTLNDFEVGGGAIRIYSIDGSIPPGANDASSPFLGNPLPEPERYRLDSVNGYRVITETKTFGSGSALIIQYGLPLASLQSEIANLDVLVMLGVLAATALAFAAGWLVARRAITPIAELTAAAAEIERTGDPSVTLPEPTADDEVAELSRTLQTMLTSLADARARTEAALTRQRAFVADASHELRTPLTSVLANLELLEVSLQGPDRELAESALRSTQRMRRLVADLLLLARSDIQQAARAQPTDLAEIVIAAAAELEPSAGDHEIELDVQPARLVGSPDDLQRVAINLIENAIRHTPAGTQIRASTRTLEDGRVELVVEDDGPGIKPEIREHLFERFVRGGGESSGSFGLGLAIVHAVTRSHGGTVTASAGARGPGARFTVTLPGAPVEQPAEEAVASSPLES
jgi:two-component system OmpR family sensor kinase